MEEFTPPKNKKEILDHINKLTFQQRLQYGSDIGTKCSNNNELIIELRNNPPPETPSIDLDETLCEILTPQERNVSKHFHQHQLALTAAVSTKKHLHLLKEEIKSQSKFLKKYVIRNYIKQQTNDQDIVELVKSTPPAIQKQLIHVLIKEKRIQCLDILCDEMRIIAGIDFMVTFLHGCSTKKVIETLKFKNILTHKLLRWDKLFRFHQPMIISMIESQLKKAPLIWNKYNEIYNLWKIKDKDSIYKKNRLSAWEEMLQTNNYQSKALWNLCLLYPHCMIDPCLTRAEKIQFEEEIKENDNKLKTFDDIRIK
eukprot:207206_1